MWHRQLRDLLVLLSAQNVVSTGGFASWQGLRGVQIRSLITLEGGLVTSGTFADGQWTNAAGVPNTYGTYYYVNLTQSFNVQNQSTDQILIDSYTATNVPEDNGVTDFPNYVYGGMFHNDYQWYTFGGLATTSPEQHSSVTQGDVFASGPVTQAVFKPTFKIDVSTGSVSDNITSGAYASSPDPDQPLGFYFGGMISATGADLEYSAGDDDPNHPTIGSNAFIKIDMKTADDPVFTAMQWPGGATSRSEGGLVWLPYGKAGVVIAIGGVEIPGDLFSDAPPRDTVNNTFMTELLIYDVDGQTWHTQTTLEDSPKPSQLASFCTAVFATQDGYSHEIFVYGGYDGTYTSADPNARDDVWVLSVPEFQWTKLYSAPADSTHGRQGSVCFAPNPTSMITIGGTTAFGSYLGSDTIIDVFDTTTSTWTGVFDSSSEDKFAVPDAIVTQLQYPDNKGPGKAVVPTLNDTLSDLFNTAYPNALPVYTPYSDSSGNSTNGGSGGEGKKNNWKIPVIATLCTVIPVLLIALAVCLCMRRRRQHKRGMNRTQQSRKNVFSWLKSSAVDPKTEKSHTSDDTVVESNPDYFAEHKNDDGQLHEAPSNVPSPGLDPYGSTTAGAMRNPNERYEIMDHPPRDTSSLQNHPYYPRSLSGDHIISATTNTGSVSRFSEGFANSSGNGDRHELPEQRSRDQLTGRKPLPKSAMTQPTAEPLSPRPDESTMMTVSAASDAGQPLSGRRPSTPVRSPVSAGPVPDGPGHQRNQSSLGSTIPNLPSPGPEEDHRMSRQIDGLPDVPPSPETRRDGLGRLSE